MGITLLDFLTFLSTMGSIFKYVSSKGQLISKYSFYVFKSTKKTNEIFVRISALASKKGSNQKSSVRESTLATPPRTHRISGLKSQISKPTFLA